MPVEAALFAIVSPLQYINALEAIHSFGLKPEQCYLAIGESRKLQATGRQLESILDRGLWRQVQSISGLPVAKGLFRLHSELRYLRGAREYALGANKLIEQARAEFGKIGWLFLGDYRPSNFRHFLASVPEAEHWLLDDGSVTHQVVRFRKDPHSPNLFAKPFARASRLVRLRSKISGLKFSDPGQLGFFSCYDIEVAPQDRLRANSYEYYRQCYPTMRQVDEIWVLGSNHSENRFTSEGRYLALLERIRDFYAGEPVVYLPHRGESEAKLERVTELGFTLRGYDLPIEIVVGKRGEYPRVLAGIASSAIDNLSVILGDRLKVHLIRVEPGYSEKERWKHLRDVIEYHQRNVHGITLEWPESEAGYFNGRGIDYRIHHCSDPSSIASQGSFRQRSGLLGGTWEGTLQVDGDARQVSFRPSHRLKERPWQVGQWVRIRSPATGQQFSAQIDEVQVSGEVLATASEDVTLNSPAPVSVTLMGPRLEWDATRRPVGLLIEPGSTNLLRSTRTIAAPHWQSVGLEPVHPEHATTPLLRAPDGEKTAAFIKLDRSHGEHLLFQRVGRSEGGPLTFSVYLSAGGINEVELAITHLASGTTLRRTFFLTQSAGGVAETPSGPPQTSISTMSAAPQVTDLWRRCALSGAQPAGEIAASIHLKFADQDRYPGDGCSGLYVWGPQLEPNPQVTSYVPCDESPGERERDEVVFDTSGGNECALIELSLPKADQPVSLLTVNGGRLEVDPSHLRLRFRHGSNVYEGSAPPLTAREPFVLGVQKRGSDLWLSVNGSEPLKVRGLGSLPIDVRAVGGPLHLRRSLSLPPLALETAFAAVCSLDSFSKLARPSSYVSDDLAQDTKDTPAS